MGGQGPNKKLKNYYCVYKLLKESKLSHKEISKILGISTELVQGINTGRYYYNHDMDYPIRKLNNPINYCCDCGKEIYKKSKRCITCNANNKLIKLPSINNLISNLIEFKNIKLLANYYKISTTLLKKWFLMYGVNYKYIIQGSLVKLAITSACHAEEQEFESPTNRQ